MKKAKSKINIQKNKKTSWITAGQIDQLEVLRFAVPITLALGLPPPEKASDHQYHIRREPSFPAHYIWCRGPVKIIYYKIGKNNKVDFYRLKIVYNTKCTPSLLVRKTKVDKPFIKYINDICACYLLSEDQ